MAGFTRWSLFGALAAAKQFTPRSVDVAAFASLHGNFLRVATAMQEAGMQHGRNAAWKSNQARKSLRLCLAGLRIGWFDPVAEASQLADDSRCALLPRLFGDGWAPFFVTSSLVQDQPDQSTLSMGDGPDGLIMSQARDRTAIHDLEDASFGPGCGVRSLIE